MAGVFRSTNLNEAAGAPSLSPKLAFVLSASEKGWDSNLLGLFVTAALADC